MKNKKIIDIIDDLDFEILDTIDSKDFLDYPIVQEFIEDEEIKNPYE